MILPGWAARLRAKANRPVLAVSAATNIPRFRLALEARFDHAAIEGAARIRRVLAAAIAAASIGYDPPVSDGGAYYSYSSGDTGY